MRARVSSVPRAVGDAAGLGVAAVLAGLGVARAGKPVHPHGVVHEARLRIHGAPDAPSGAELLRTPADHLAIMRFSRSLGLPGPVPDLLGIAVRIVDAYGPARHQDLLTVSSVDLPVLHHGFVPAADVQQRPYTSSLPFRAGGRSFLLGVLPEPASPRLGGDDEFDRLARAAATGRLTFGLAVAPVTGRFRRIGTFHVGERLSGALDALRFRPTTCGGGLEPAGLLNRWRDVAYPASQAAWARRDARAAAQAAADAELRHVARRWHARQAA